ncbi:MAG: hypothetical protein ABEJ22_09525 [Haloferacaceae archaeon]
MSQTESEGVLARAYRTVTPPMHGHVEPEMDVIGWIIFLGLVVIMLPLLPFVALVWILTKLADVLTMEAPEEEAVD